MRAIGALYLVVGVILWDDCGSEGRYVQTVYALDKILAINSFWA